MNDKTLTFEHMRRVVDKPELAGGKYGLLPHHLRPDRLQKSSERRILVQTTLPLPKP